ncbi:hypothetical protein [Luteolibacter soli]|uniref:Uncharacterized protein n=1 Tax=Luteolibacter soli TaxID=3135280 RepID=A0ABU9AZ59_9BACT
MKLKLPLLPLLAAVMFPASPVQATPEIMELTCTVTGQYQHPGNVSVSSSSETIVGKLTNIAITAKDLIRFAGDENETEYPAGSALQVDLGYFKPTIAATKGSSTYARVWVIDKDGVRLEDVTEFICISFDFDSLIYSGTVDWVTDQEDTRNRFAAKMHLRFPSKGIQMTFRGNCTEFYKLSAPNNDGDQRERGNVIFTGDGSGYFDEMLWVGKIVAHLVGNSVLNFD